jgi:cytochrome c peroxidase
MKAMRPVCAIALVFALPAVFIAAAEQPERFRTWKVPATFPLPQVPADNTLTDSKVELGRYLFYDTRMSGNGTQSCATCHQQQHAFTDTRTVAVGSTGEKHTRNPMSLVNVAYTSFLTWANPTMTRLEDQALVPMYGDHPIELGLDKDDHWLSRLAAEPLYAPLFTGAYGTPDMTRDRVVKAIASFERSIVSARSPFDRYHFDRDDGAVSAAARRGEVLFHSRALSCFQCHGGVNFSSAMTGEPRPRMDPEFPNTGLYNLAGALSYPPDDAGVYQITHNPRDVGRFKPPTLRNVAVTAPYMHDGSMATLDEVIDHYAAGGRTIASGPHAGVGHDNPNKSDAVHGFTLTTDQRADLIEFLRSLTDEALLTDPDFASPWPASSTTGAAAAAPRGR